MGGFPQIMLRLIPVLLCEVHARWINELFTYLKDRPDDIKKGFEKAGITAACRADFVVDENPFSDLV